MEDVASAVDCALDMRMDRGQSETFYITAREHYGPLPTVEIIRRNWGDDIPIDLAYYEERPFGSIFDIRKAETLLGWRPEWSVDRIVQTHRED